MSVEPNELMNEVWTRWQGHLVNGVFPLGRYLGCSDHSGVFLTQSAAGAELAIKLVPTNRTLAEGQLPRWKRAGALAHPHLLRLLEWGGCQLDGLPYLYTVMEYADQTLAQLLLNRALAGNEAQEMLPPILDALAFLHGRSMLQGQLRPTNVLVVGDQLKLASDTIRRVSDGPLSNHAPTAYDAPEERQGVSSPAADVWALGVTLSEALTRQKPRGLGEGGKTVVLPGDFPAALRDVVAACLSPNPNDRPSVTDLLLLAGGRAPGAATGEAIAPKPAAPAAAPPRASAATVTSRPAAVRRAELRSRSRPLLVALVAAAVMVALIWLAVRLHTAHRSPSAAVLQPPQASASGTSGAGPSPVLQAPPAAASDTKPSRSEASTSPVAAHEVVPDVPAGARHTIHGHINVWIRVIIDQQGSVIAASTDRNGPSRYFQRLAIDAAKQWKFPPVDTSAHRLMQIRFDFDRDGTTARAVPVH